MLPTAGRAVPDPPDRRASATPASRTSCWAPPTAPRCSRTTSATASALGVELEYVVETEPLGTGGGIRNVADRAARRHRAGLQRRQPHPGSTCARCSPRTAHRRRRHAVPAPGRRPARVRLRAHRRRRAGHRVPGEGPEPGHRPDQRRALRRSAASVIDTIPTGRAGVGRARDVPGPAAPPGRPSSGTSTPATGATSARPRTSWPARPTSCAASRRRRRCPDRPATRWCCPAPRSTRGRAVVGGTTVGAGCVVGAGRGGRRLGRVRRRADRRPARSCAARWSAPARWSARAPWSRTPSSATAPASARGVELRAGARVWPDVVLADGAVRFSSDL